MKNLILFFILSVSFFAYGQETDRVSITTTDEDTDSYLSDINIYASSDMVSFRKDLSEKFGASEGEMDKYLIEEKIEPSDVYYGYVLSYTTREPISSIMKMHSEKKGWGSVAQELGIKPGSDEFHSLKENTYKIDREKIKMIKEQKNEDKMIEKESNKEADKIKVDDKGKKFEESPKKQKK